MPRKYKINTFLTEKKIGYERRQELQDDVTGRELNLPSGVYEEDMDRAFRDFVKNDISSIFEGKEVPVLFLSIQRYSEFTKFWSSSDDYKDLTLPFITITRNPNPKKGTIYGDYANIPGNRTYTHYKVETLVGGKRGMDLYQIPQPTPIDLEFTIKLFSSKLRELNVVNEKIHQLFNSKQYYIYPKGHPMSIILDNVSDSSEINDLQSRRYFVQEYSFILRGYILDEKKFIVKQAINRLTLNVTAEEKKPNGLVLTRLGKNIILNFFFTSTSEFRLNFTSDFKGLLELVYDKVNVDNILLSINGNIMVNGDVVLNQFNINYGDIIYLEVTPINPNEDVSLKFSVKI